MISDASPVGTFRSAKNRTELAPGSRIPITMQEISSGRPMRSVPRRTSTTKIVISAPAVMKRVEAANSGAIVSPAYAIPRYVDPQMM